MKPLKYILIALVWILFTSSAIGQDMNMDGVDRTDSLYIISYGSPVKLFEFPKKTVKSRQYVFTVSTIYLMELYMDWVKEQEVHIGWEFISNEQFYSDGSTLGYTSQSLYYPIALEYIYPYNYDHDYRGRIAYDLDPNMPIEEYGYILNDYGIMDFERTEKIMKPMKPSFEGFLKWTQKYFKDEKDSFTVKFD